eukprot:10161494-Alexandrium_andersonii.AAC.1
MALISFPLSAHWRPGQPGVGGRQGVPIMPSAMLERVGSCTRRACIDAWGMVHMVPEHAALVHAER